MEFTNYNDAKETGLSFSLFLMLPDSATRIVYGRYLEKVPLSSAYLN